MLSKYVLIVIVFLSLYSCGDSSLIEPKNPLFSGTTLIDTYAPSGSSSGAWPVFKWKSPSSMAYQIVGVFNAPIIVSGKQIQNKTACIAMWHNGLTGSAGNVSFSNFVQVVNGSPTSTMVTALSGSYHWAVWAMDGNMIISNSSVDVSFTSP